MGYLRNEFRLNGNSQYPLAEEIVARLRNSTNLDLEFDEEKLVLSHKSLKSPASFKLLDKRSIEMEISIPGYLWWHLTFTFIEMTIDLGGGEGIIDTLSTGDPPPIVIQAGDREEIYKYFWLTRRIEWAKEPHQVAKNMEGYKDTFI